MITIVHNVQYYETDKMGITHHANYIHWMEEARVAMLARMDFSYDRLEAMGIVSPVMALDCKYKAPCTFPDAITIEAGIESFNGVVLRMRYAMRKQDGTLVCQGHSEHCFLNDKGRFIRLNRDFPEFYQALMDGVEGEQAAKQE